MTPGEIYKKYGYYILPQKPVEIVSQPVQPAPVARNPYQPVQQQPQPQQPARRGGCCGKR